MSELQDRLRNDLTAAMRRGDRGSVRTLRTLLSSIANAEAQPAMDETSPSLRSDNPIAGATPGLAATEVARRSLGPAELLAIVRAEYDEHVSAAEDLASRGADEAAEVHRADAALLRRYLD